MNRKLLLTTACFVCLSFIANAQNFVVPENVSFKEKADYATFESSIIEASKWLEATRIGQEADKRTTVNAFVLQWIEGSPTVTIELGKLALSVSENNPDLLVVLIAGYARYVLENSYSKDQAKAYTAAIKSVVNCYQLGGDLKRNKLIEKVIEKDKEQKLEEWVTAQVKKS